MHGYSFDTIIAGAFCEHGNIVARSNTESSCANNPCLNLGSCISQGLSYECKCSPGFTGKNCEMTMKCYSNPCQHDGLCHDFVSY